MNDGLPSCNLTLAPDTSWSAIVERSGGRELTPDESAEFQRDYASLMLQPDCEPWGGAPALWKRAADESLYT